MSVLPLFDERYDGERPYPSTLVTIDYWRGIGDIRRERAVCYDCGLLGPEDSDGLGADAKAIVMCGWTHLFHGSVRHYRCAECARRAS